MYASEYSLMQLRSILTHGSCAGSHAAGVILYYMLGGAEDGIEDAHSTLNNYKKPTYTVTTII